MTTQTKPAAPASQARPSRSLIAIVVFAIVAVIGAIAFFALTSDSNPTVSFDGETAVYDGPATLEAGEHTFVFDASAYEGDETIAFSIGEITDPNITEAEMAAYENPRDYRQPPFIGRSKLFYIQAGDEDRVLEETFLLDAGTRYTVGAFVRGGSGDIAQIVEVE